MTRDPELRYSAASGLPYALLTLAVTKQAPQPDGSVRKTVSIIDVEVRRHQAEICVATLRRGSTCMVVGSIQSIDRTDKDGRTSSCLKVEADRVQFLDRRIETPVPLAPDSSGGQSH
jgi:single-strand DNA-binding protein